MQYSYLLTYALRETMLGNENFVGVLVYAFPTKRGVG